MKRYEGFRLVGQGYEGFRLPGRRNGYEGFRLA
jgi:hypothetical protein